MSKDNTPHPHQIENVPDLDNSASQTAREELNKLALEMYAVQFPSEKTGNYYRSSVDKYIEAAIRKVSLARTAIVKYNEMFDTEQLVTEIKAVLPNPVFVETKSMKNSFGKNAVDEYVENLIPYLTLKLSAIEDAYTGQSTPTDEEESTEPSLPGE